MRRCDGRGQGRGIVDTHTRGSVGCVVSFFFPFYFDGPSEMFDIEKCISGHRATAHPAHPRRRACKAAKGAVLYVEDTVPFLLRFIPTDNMV